MNPIVLDCPAQRTAVIRLTVPRAEIQHVMGPGIQEVYGALQAQGLTPAGPWLSHHVRLDPAVFDVEIAVPVDADVAPMGRVLPAPNTVALMRVWGQPGVSFAPGSRSRGWLRPLICGKFTAQAPLTAPMPATG
jgi:hypothetical protein